MCFDLYKGNWEVSPSYGSSSAYNFWNNVIDSYSDIYTYVDGMFMFNNGDE